MCPVRFLDRFNQRDVWEVTLSTRGFSRSFEFEFPPGESLWVYALLALPFVADYYHPQNRNYITYCKAARRKPSHSRCEHALKNWWSLNISFVRYACGQTHRQTNRQTDRTRLFVLSIEDEVMTYEFVRRRSREGVKDREFIDSRPVDCTLL